MNIRKIICFLLTILVVFLFSYSIYGTIIFLEIDFNKKSENASNSEIITNKDKENKIYLTGNTSGNLSQHYQDDISSNIECTGGIVFSDDYIYKVEKLNTKHVILQIELKTNESFPIISGHKYRNLLLLNKHIYCIVETQNENNIVCEKIAKISTKGDEIIFFNSTESSKITSMLSDGEEIYYTKEDSRYIYKINLSGEIYSYIYKVKETGENPYLFGLENGKLYYVDGYEMASIDLNNYSKTHISYQYCNKMQNPILEDEKIFVFKNLLKSELSYIDIKTNEVITMFNNENLLEENIKSSNITNINYYKNNIFFNVKEQIYYINIEDKKISKIAGITSGSKTFYFNKNYIITELEKYGSYSSDAIAYILAK